MVDQKAKGEGKNPVGAMNPIIYSIAGSSQYSSTFHDVTSGDNGTDKSGTGYDLTTGWGSMQGDNLADPLINGTAPAPSNDFSVTAAPSSVSVDPGKSVTTSITTTVTKGDAQDIALSAGRPGGLRRPGRKGRCTPVRTVPVRRLSQRPHKLGHEICAWVTSVCCFS